MAHSHFVHDLKVVLILMPGPLHVEIKWEHDRSLIEVSYKH